MATALLRPGRESRSTRLWRVREIADRLDRPFSVLGVLFVLIVLGQNLSTHTRLQLGFAIAGWVLWALFAGEFLLRLYIAPDRWDFLRHNWWQLVFLAVPFLRFLRALRALRAARAGGVFSSAVRGTRSARGLLSGRVSWLVVVTVIVMLGSSQLLYALGDYVSYAAALHDVALATMTGEPLGKDTPVARTLEVLLAAYSVAVFASLAGAIGAFFLSSHADTREQRDE